MNTKELAKKFKVSVRKVHRVKYKDGHFEGYEPYSHGKVAGILLWRFVGL